MRNTKKKSKQQKYYLGNVVFGYSHETKATLQKRSIPVDVGMGKMTSPTQALKKPNVMFRLNEVPFIFALKSYRRLADNALILNLAVTGDNHAYVAEYVLVDRPDLSTEENAAFVTIGRPTNVARIEGQSAGYLGQVSLRVEVRKDGTLVVLLDSAALVNADREAKVEEVVEVLDPAMAAFSVNVEEVEEATFEEVVEDERAAV